MTFFLKEQLTFDKGLIKSRSKELDLSLHLVLTCFFVLGSIPSNASSNVLSK